MARRSRDNPDRPNRARATAARSAATAGASRRRRRATALASLAASLILASVCSSAPCRADQADALACEREMVRAAAVNDIPLNVLYAVGLTETGHRGTLGPYDMNVDGRAVHSATLDEAMTRFAQETQHGARFIDIGCMQINHHWHAADFRSLTDMFDPASNVRYAANFLKDLRQREGS